MQFGINKINAGGEPPPVRCLVQAKQQHVRDRRNAVLLRDAGGERVVQLLHAGGRTCMATRPCPRGSRGASPSCSTSPSGTVHARGKARNHLRTTPASAATAIVPTRLVVLPMAMSAGAWNTTMATLTSPMDAEVLSLLNQVNNSLTY